MQKKITLQAHAKLNLRLKVTGRRDDGYHSLSMLNVPLALADELSITWRTDGPDVLELTGPYAGDAGELSDNIVLRASLLVRTACSLTGGFSIALTKNIPGRGGLGGGSSDAATVLKGIMQMSQQVLTNVELTDLALKLGSDVPFFLTSRPSLVAGRGEEVTPIDMPWCKGWPCLLILPPFGISTPLAYQRFRQLGAPTSPDAAFVVSTAPEEWQLDSEKLGAVIDNDLLPIAQSIAPEMSDIIRSLANLPDGWWGMTGSGSTLFVLPRKSTATAERLFDEVRRRVSPLQCKTVVTHLIA